MQFHEFPPHAKTHRPICNTHAYIHTYDIKGKVHRFDALTPISDVNRNRGLLIGSNWHRGKPPVRNCTTATHTQMEQYTNATVHICTRYALLETSDSGELNSLRDPYIYNMCARTSNKTTINCLP